MSNCFTFDFDHAPDRHGSMSYKWDTAPVHAPEDVIPLWVADMDFATAPTITRALRCRAQHPVYGYTAVPPAYYRTLDHWFSTRHGFSMPPARVIYTSGVVPAISAILKAYTVPGDGVIVQTPVYNCFFSCIRNQGCVAVENPLTKVPLGDGSFTYAMDLDQLELLASDPRNTAMLLCSPHNPVGRCWTASELEQVADICARHGVTLISDEIHCELTLPGFRFISLAALDSQAAKKAIICNSPSKAFNIAGIQIANILAPDTDSHRRINRAINDNEVCDINCFAPVALMAAYNHGADWLDELRCYISGNYTALRTFLSAELPQLTVARLEATYLAWVDCSAITSDTRKLEDFLLKYGVWLNAGEMYGAPGYLRINLACPRKRLMEGLRRMATGIREF